MLGEGRVHNLGHGHRAEARLALRWPELGDAGPSAEELAVDPDLAAEEVDPVDGEPEALALAKPHAGTEDDEGAVPVRHGGDERLQLAESEGYHLGIVALGESDLDAWRGGDETVADRRFENRRHPPVDELDRAGCEDTGELLHPRLDLAAADGAQGPATERWVGMQAQVGLELGGRLARWTWAARHCSA